MGFLNSRYEKRSSLEGKRPQGNSFGMAVGLQFRVLKDLLVFPETQLT
jgi:hypothetical protein